MLAKVAVRRLETLEFPLQIPLLSQLHSVTTPSLKEENLRKFSLELGIVLRM